MLYAHTRVRGMHQEDNTYLHSARARAMLIVPDSGGYVHGMCMHSNTAAHMQQAYSGHACTRYGRHSAPRCMPCGRSMTAKQKGGGMPYNMPPKGLYYSIIGHGIVFRVIFFAANPFFRACTKKRIACRKSVARSYFSQNMGGVHLFVLFIH